MIKNRNENSSSSRVLRSFIERCVSRRSREVDFKDMCQIVLEWWTSTAGSELSAVVSCDFDQMFGQIVSIRVKNTQQYKSVASRHIEREKDSLPVDVRRSKTSLLKLPGIIHVQICPFAHKSKYLYKVLVAIVVKLARCHSLRNSYRRDSLQFFFAFL